MGAGAHPTTLRFDVLGCRGELEGAPEHHGGIDLAVAAQLLSSRALEEVDCDDLAALALYRTSEWAGRNGTSWLVTRTR